MAKDANQIAAEYGRRSEGGLLPGIRPRTGTLSIWPDGDLHNNPYYVSNEVTAQVQGSTIIATGSDGEIEVFALKPGAYASFVYDEG